MIERLFVYGTLAPGEVNAAQLAQVAGHWQQASVTGYYDVMGWGKTQGYPGVVLDPGGESIAGWLLTSSQLHRHWPRLDRFEGSRYRRQIVRVRTATGKQLRAYIYCVKPALLNDPNDKALPW